jgi:hypothetical protein
LVTDNGNSLFIKKEEESKSGGVCVCVSLV